MEDDTNAYGIPVPNTTVQFREYRWNIVRKIYDGVFSQVFMIEDANDPHKIFAMKVERKDSSQRLVMKLDVQVLTQLRGQHGFPRLLTAGRTEHFNFCVMKFVGPELAQLQKLTPENKFSASTLYRVALQTLDRIKTLHSHGWLNRDVKANNFAVGLGQECGIVYMLDFGLTRRFKTHDNKLRPLRPSGPCVGTFPFAPLAAGFMEDQSPKDDLEGWFYMILHMYRGHLPWFGWHNISCDHGATREFKVHARHAFRKKLFANLHPAWELMLDTIVNTRHDEQPGYRMLENLIMRIVDDEKIDLNSPYDWQVIPALVNEMQRASVGHPHHNNTSKVSPRKSPRKHEVVDEGLREYGHRAATVS